MASAKIMLMAEANKLGIDGYRRMSEDDLAAAIDRAKGKGSAPKGKAAKGKASVNGTKGKAAGSKVVKGKAKSSATVTKGKASPPAKSAAQKTSPAKGKAAKGTAKRASTSTTKGKATVTKGKTSPAKGRTSAKPKGKTKTAPATTRSRTSRKPQTGRVEIDNKAVNWKAESNVGLTGKRKVVLDSLRANKGDKVKVFKAIRRNALKWYPNALNTYPSSPDPKHAAERMVVWLIGRVAFDFAKTTGQHTPGTRAGYGQSKKSTDVRRRELREERREERAKAERSAKRKASASRKAAPAKGRKPASRKTAKGAKGRKGK